MMLSKILASFAAPAEWILRMFNGWDEYDHHHRGVTSEKALSYAPIWYGVNKIAGHIGQLPIGVYKKLPRGAERDRMHSVHRLMRRPNAYQTSIVFRETLAAHSLLDGAGRAAIVRDRVTRRITELLPLQPDVTSTGMLAGIKYHASRPSPDDRVRLFFKSNKEQPGDNDMLLFDDSEVLHIPGLSYDGITGIPLRNLARRNLSASIAAEERLANQMENGYSGSLVLQAPTGVFRKQADAEEFLEAFEKRHNSAENAGRVGMLREGITANVIAMNNKDAEMIENRRFQRQDAALLLGLEQILGDDTSVSYNSLEQKNLAYLMNCLNKWLKRWEEEIEYKLLPTRQFNAESHFVRFMTGALLKSDYRTSVESLAMAIAATIISPNEAREKLDMNPYPGGDKFQNPAITPGDDSDPEPEPDDDEPNDDMSARARVAIYSRIAHLIGVEAGKVSSAAKRAKSKGKNFLAWVDDFYDKRWETEFANRLEEIGMDRQLASLHCQESKRRLLEVCDYSTPETLAENVGKCVVSWKSRANTIGETSHVQL